MADTDARSWEELSETVLGLMSEERLAPMVAAPEWFKYPMNEGVKVLQKPGGRKEDLMKVLPQDLITHIHNRVSSMNGSGEWYDWVGGLKDAYEGQLLADQYERDARALRQNKPVDLQRSYAMTTAKLTRGESGLVRATDIDYSKYKPFIKSGNEYIDRIIGGYPADGPIVIFGDTGTGKSHFGAGAVVDILKAHVDWTAAIYTFEMGVKHWMWRESQMYPAMNRMLDRLYVSSTQDAGGEQMMAEILQKRPNFVLIDDMDNMVKGEASPAKYEAQYKVIKTICRLLEIPVMVLGQPNRTAKTSARFLRKWDISWSGAGENSAALLIGLQNATKLRQEWADTTYPTENRLLQYMMFMKSRDDWPMQRGPGAIITEMGPTIWKGKLWHDEWKLHPDISMGRAMGVVEESEDLPTEVAEPITHGPVIEEV